MIWFKKNYLFYFLLTNDLYYSKNNDIFKLCRSAALLPLSPLRKLYVRFSPHTAQIILNLILIKLNRLIIII